MTPVCLSSISDINLHNQNYQRCSYSLVSTVQKSQTLICLLPSQSKSSIALLQKLISSSVNIYSSIIIYIFKSNEFLLLQTFEYRYKMFKGFCSNIQTINSQDNCLTLKNKCLNNSSISNRNQIKQNFNINDYARNKLYMKDNTYCNTINRVRSNPKLYQSQFSGQNIYLNLQPKNAQSTKLNTSKLSTSIEKQQNYRYNQFRPPTQHIMPVVSSCHNLYKFGSQNDEKQNKQKQKKCMTNIELQYYKLVKQNKQLKNIINTQYLPLKKCFQNLKQQHIQRQHLVHNLQIKIKKLAQQLQHKSLKSIKFNHI